MIPLKLQRMKFHHQLAIANEIWKKLQKQKEKKRKKKEKIWKKEKRSHGLEVHLPQQRLVA
jgi:hypothetical protein